MNMKHIVAFTLKKKQIRDIREQDSKANLQIRMLSERRVKRKELIENNRTLNRAEKK